MAKKKNAVPKKNTTQTPQQRESKAAARAAAKAKQKREKRNRVLRITAITVAGVAAVAVIGVGVSHYVQHSGVLMHSRVAASTKNFSLSNAEYCYFYDQCYDSYIGYMQANGMDLSFDPEKKLRDQVADEDITWHDYFLKNANIVVQQVLQYCEMAQEAGYQLDAGQLADCAENAAAYDMTGLPKGVEREDIQVAMELEMLGNSYYSERVDAIEITDEEIKQGYEQNMATYQMWDMLCYTIAWSEDANTSNTALKQEDAERYAKELAACESPEAFEAYVLDFLMDVKQKTEEEAQKLVNAMKLSTNGASYSAPVSKWAMEESPALHDTYLYNESGQTSYQVYMLTSLPTRNESDAVDFRVIVLPYATYTDQAGAMEKADELMAEWEKNGSTEAAFRDLAATHTSDSSNYQTGGMVSAYSYDRTTYGMEILEWLYADGRKEGDTTIIAADDAGNGVVLMAYYVQDNPLAVWENQVKDDLYEAELKTISDAQKLIPVSINDKNQQNLDF